MKKIHLYERKAKQLIISFNESLYYRNFCGDSLGQVEAVNVGDVAKWIQNLIYLFFPFPLVQK